MTKARDNRPATDGRAALLFPRSSSCCGHTEMVPSMKPLNCTTRWTAVQKVVRSDDLKGRRPAFAKSASLGGPADDARRRAAGAGTWRHGRRLRLTLPRILAGCIAAAAAEAAVVGAGCRCVRLRITRSHVAAYSIPQPVNDGGNFCVSSFVSYMQCVALPQASAKALHAHMPPR